MGMFDYIECEMDLPRAGDRIPHFRYEHQFQTKDLVNALIEYKIDKEGVLHLKKIEYEKRELTDEEQKEKDGGGFWHPMWSLEPISEEWVKEDFTGYINFYDFIHNLDAEHDAWVEYEVHIKDGKVEGGVQLKEFKEESNKERIASSKRIKAEMKARKEYQQKLRYRFFGKQWNWVIRLIFRGTRKVGSWLNNSWKIEDKLKF